VTKDKEKNHKNNESEEIKDIEEQVDVVAEEEIEELDTSEDLQLDDSVESEAEDEFTQLKVEAAEYLDGWQRARAEFANYKKRVERESEEVRQRIASEIILRYLNIMDDLERAIDNAPDEQDMLEWVSGIELIYQKFGALLEAEGVEPIETEGERFDPNLHEAISYEESEEYEGGSIIAVTQSGYKLGDRIIRPAMVRVAK
jgi:molecular chaperone GrpE